MSYSGRRGSGYGNQRRGSHGGFSGKRKGRNDDFSPRDTAVARQAFEKRSKRSQAQDLVRVAEIAPSLQMYLAHPNKFDFPNVDMADPRRIFEHKTPREKAADLAKLAKKQPLEVWVRDTSEADLQGVDTPKNKVKAPTSKRKRFKIIKKSERKKQVEKALETVEKKVEVELKELAKVEPQKAEEIKRHMPTQDEIYAEAVQMWQSENNKPVHGDFMENVANPTRGELQEEGLLNQAKLKLMTSEDTQASRVTMDYVEGLRAELNKIGFEVIPMEGFSVEDLKY